MKNPNSTSGAGEDVIRSIVQFGAAEMHLKTLYEKTSADIENAVANGEENEDIADLLEKLDAYREEILEVAQLRRRAMLALYEMYPEGDKDAWCLVKHLGIGAMTAFEAWETNDQDPGLLSLAMSANKSFVKAVSRFIGMEITDCAACLSDFLKAEGDTSDY